MKNLCLYPWYHLANDHQGRVHPCCIYQDKIKKPDGSYYYLQKDKIEDIFKSEYLQELRQKFLRDERPSECNICWNDEDIGIPSKRQKFYDELKYWMDIKPEVPKVFDYPLDMQLILNNSCNLKCRICTPELSSSWLKEMNSYSNSELSLIEKKIPKFPHGQSSDSKGVFLNDMDSWGPNIRKMNCLGGEPFYSDAWKKMALKFIEKGWSKNVSLGIVSNGTFFDKQFLDLLLQNFKSIGVSLSIDGMESAFEYVRSNGKWDDVKENFYRFREYSIYPNFTFNITYSTNWLSLMQIPKFLDFINENMQVKVNVWFNKVAKPYFMNPAFAPKDVKEYIVEKIKKSKHYGFYANDLEGLLNYVLNYNVEVHKGDYKKYFNQHLFLDKQRDTNLWQAVDNTDKILYKSLRKFYDDL